MPDPESAEALLDLVAETYASCTSYRDSGETVDVSGLEGRPFERRRSSLPFRTWLVRPDHFRFEWAERAIGPEEEWGRQVIWMNDGRPKTWWTVQPDEVYEHEELLMHLGGATGVSHGSTIVPHVLLADDRRRWLGRGPCEMRGIELVEGHECHVIHTERAADRAETIWIDVKISLIRRIVETETRTEASALQLEAQLREHAKADPRMQEVLGRMRRTPLRVGGRREVTRTYFPETNVPIDPAIFDFKPPVDPD